MPLLPRHSFPAKAGNLRKLNLYYFHSPVLSDWKSVLGRILLGKYTKYAIDILHGLVSASKDKMSETEFP